LHNQQIILAGAAAEILEVKAAAKFFHN